MATKKDGTTIEPVQITLDTYSKEKRTGKVKKGKEHALIQTGASAEDAALVAGIINQSRSDSVTLSTIKGHQLGAAVVFARMLLAKDDPRRLPCLVKPNGRALPALVLWQMLSGNDNADAGARTKAKTVGEYVLRVPRAQDIGSIESVYNLVRDSRKAAKAGEDPEKIIEAQREAMASGVIDDANSGAEALALIREHVAESSAQVQTIANRSQAKSQAEQERAKFGRLLANGDPAAMAEGVLGVIAGKDAHAFTLALARLSIDRADNLVQDWTENLVAAIGDLIEA